MAGLKVLEFAALGPTPFAGMLLSDLGADVLRIERKDTPDPAPHRFDARGRRTLAMDLKEPAAVALCLDLAEKADILIEGHRPGVMERLGLGPVEVLARNPKLVYGRMTGWGQSGPYAHTAGHDINYLALTGALHAVGPAEQPVPPLNLGADYGGGAMFLIAGVLAGVISARATGAGQVIDAAMTDGASYLMTLFYGFLSEGRWEDRRAANFLDGGAHFYNTYQCSDGKWISIGPIEPKFYALLMDKLGETGPLRDEQPNKASWPRDREALGRIFSGKTRAQWCEIFEGSDVCFAPVLSLREAPSHPHNVARKTFVELGGMVQPAPAPRFFGTPAQIRSAPLPIGQDSVGTLSDWGIEPEIAAGLIAHGVLRCPAGAPAKEI